MRTTPFGRFKGTALSEIPDGYVVWLLSRSDLREPLRSALVNEAITRGLIGAAATTAPVHPQRGSWLPGDGDEPRQRQVTPLEGHRDGGPFYGFVRW